MYILVKDVRICVNGRWCQVFLTHLIIMDLSLSLSPLTVFSVQTFKNLPVNLYAHLYVYIHTHMHTCACTRERAHTHG